MVGVSTPKLAAAVSNAGGLGSIGIGASSVDQAREMIRETFRLTDKPFNVNVFVIALLSAMRIWSKTGFAVLHLLLNTTLIRQAR